MTSVAVDGVVTFAEGLPGFESCRQFVVVATGAGADASLVGVALRAQ